MELNGRFILSLALMACLLCPPARAAELHVMSENYPPFSHEEDGRAVGFCAAIVQRIMDRLGMDEKIVFYPWARAYMRLMGDAPAALFPMVLSPERKLFFRFVGPVFTDTVYFYKRRGRALDVTSLEAAMRVKAIGVTRDDYYHQLLVQKGFENLDISSSQTQDFRKLAQGRVDLVPMGELALPHFVGGIDGLDPEMFERVGPILARPEVYIAFSLATPDEVVRQWQQALDELKAEGVYRTIMDRSLLLRGETPGKGHQE